MFVGTRNFFVKVLVWDYFSFELYESSHEPNVFKINLWWELRNYDNVFESFLKAQVSIQIFPYVLFRLNQISGKISYRLTASHRISHNFLNGPIIVKSRIKLSIQTITILEFPGAWRWWTSTEATCWIIWQRLRWQMWWLQADDERISWTKVLGNFSVPVTKTWASADYRQSTIKVGAARPSEIIFGLIALALVSCSAGFATVWRIQFAFR